MPLTVTTDLTVISTAETITGWSNYGSGGAGAAALEPDYFVQGSNCISRGVTGAATNKGMCFDIGSGSTLNFSQNGSHYGKLIYIWVRCATPGLSDTRANGGIRVLVGSGATAPGDAAGVWSAFYVDGSDTLAATDGWKCYVFDPTLPPSTTFGGGVDLTAIRWFGAVMRATGTAKGQNFGVDQVSYGLGELRCRGANTNAGAGFKEMADADFGTVANRYGIIVEKEGVFLVKGKLVLGDAISTNSTTFTSQDETLIWEYQTYYDGTRQRPLIRNLNPNTGLPYFGLDFRGNGTGDTVITFGVKVGSGDTASGRSGSTFVGGRNKVAFDFDDGSVEGISIYGCTFRNIRGGIDMSANASTDEFIGNIVAKCGSFRAGPVKVRACSFIDNFGGAFRVFEDFKNDGAAAQALSTADPSVLWEDRLNGSNFSVPVGAEYVELLDPGGADRREVTQIGSPDTGSGALTINVTAATGLFTRTTGSYLTDGFMVGQTVVTSGFTNGGNNATKVIRALTATVMTVTDTTGLVDETGNNDERVKAQPDETTNSGDHYAEAIIRWPSAGASQGSLGVCIRMSATAEDYYYLKCDLINDQITLIRCDAGTDTTVDGPDSFAFNEDTDYLVHLIGRGTLIEGFVNGQKVTVTSSTHQTNTRVGIRGDAEADQTGDAPRLSRFGCGPITDPWGALVLASATDDAGYSDFINNARATALTTTGTYTFTSNTFSGNLVDLRDDSSGATTVNASGGSPAVLEEVDDAVTTVVNTVTLTVTCKDEAGAAIQNVQVAIIKNSDGAILMNELTNASGVATESFNYSSDTAVTINARKSTAAPVYFPEVRGGTITSSGLTLQVDMRLDDIIVL